ncbi:hypothetical protein N8A98_06980 [Devosia neptuniae]|uniref:Uncharacterized protein n=1 Tax=Devosia neptuniae TaxID=191302 RepID=A0ABY6CFA4_9HYPH|nr:hypothetical protein [Devosia neptuniae]UXN70925.1 hypothetical protein N8A98_06980 [Devosia neptuniae]
MDNVISFSSYRHKRFRLNKDAAAKVGAYVCLRPAPTESPTDFVARIVRAYHAELDGQVQA